MGAPHPVRHSPKADTGFPLGGVNERLDAAVTTSDVL